MWQPYVKATKEIWDTHLVILQMLKKNEDFYTQVQPYFFG